MEAIKPPEFQSAVVILAGGHGRRMGGEKPLRQLQGRTLIEAVIDRLEPQGVEIVINTDGPNTKLTESLSVFGKKIICDAEEYADLGPMSGVCRGLQFAQSIGSLDVITVPCDMPLLPRDFVRRLRDAAQADWDVVHFKGERDYPLCARWHVRQLPHLLAALERSKASGGLGVMNYFKPMAVRHVPVINERDFLNINTPEDLASIQSDEGYDLAR